MRTSVTAPPLGRMLTACVRPFDISDIAALKVRELIWPSSWFSAIRPVRLPDAFRETSVQYPWPDLPEAAMWLLMSNLKLSLSHTIARLTAAPPLTSESSPRQRIDSRWPSDPMSCPLPLHSPMKFRNGLDVTAADSEATRVTARANANNAVRRGAEKKDLIVGMRSPHVCLRVRLALSSVGPCAGQPAERAKRRQVGKYECREPAGQHEGRQ